MAESISRFISDLALGFLCFFGKVTPPAFITHTIFYTVISFIQSCKTDNANSQDIQNEHNYESRF